MNYKLIDNQDRAKLSEGRNYGFGGGFAKLEGDTLVMQIPLTACKDFYSEVIATEFHGKAYNIYGLNYQKTDCFDKEKNIAYLVCAILPFNRGEKYPNFDKDLAALDANYKSIESFLNYFEKKFKVKGKTKITKIADNRYLFQVPLFWCKGTYLISLYGFLSRACLYFDNKKDPLLYLSEMSNGDTYMWNSMKDKVLDMLDGFIPEQVMAASDPCPHSNGIVSFKWPREIKKVELPSVNVKVGITKETKKATICC